LMAQTEQPFAPDVAVADPPQPRRKRRLHRRGRVASRQ
jgi:hypothetical protein